MRIIAAASLLASVVVLGLAGQPARADIFPLPPFKGNDTGGIIAYSMAAQVDARQVAVDHCARYGKVVKFLVVGAPRDEGACGGAAARPQGAVPTRHSSRGPQGTV